MRLGKGPLPSHRRSWRNSWTAQYNLHNGPPDKQVSAQQKKDIWRAIAKDVRTLGVYHRRSTHCRKRWEDICRWSKKTAEAQLGMASQRGRGARRTMTPLMFRILVVAYPELDGRLRASQQAQGGWWLLCLPYGSSSVYREKKENAKTVPLQATTLLGRGRLLGVLSPELLRRYSPFPPTRP
ncbi:hypothetical protein NDU88_006697 [Pleurodeles waltl]|uniref:Myb/SANT-like DNA-binding domain-containing protein n=1 Tax=Pleurodeles waltl TaxID=8319 RepID=A0AAV7X222_PLEWA|nr:hypothetical protein NDU88_006697 [Pleurodeles waltl]